MQIKLDGRVAVVTGAACGIGEAIAIQLASSGARLALVDIDRAGAEQTAAAIRASSQGEATVIEADLSDVDAASGVMPAVREAMGRVDILVNNAGLCPLRSIEEITIEEWNKVMDTNLRSVFILSKAVMEDFQDGNGGRIINLASGAGKSGGHAAHYAATKAGIISLTKTFASSLARYNVTVNAVAPGPTKTDDPERWPPDVVARLESMIPMGRLGTPEDIAAMVVFLASDLAGFITGEIVDVNGGTIMD